MVAQAKPYLEALQRHELRLPWCLACGKPHFYPRTACPHCWGADYDWRPAAGTGVVYTFVVVRSNPPTVFREMLPFVIAIVELEEGIRMLTNIIGDTDGLAIGDGVALEFIERNGLVLPVFRRMA